MKAEGGRKSRKERKMRREVGLRHAGAWAKDALFWQSWIHSALSIRWWFLDYNTASQCNANRL